MFTNKNKLIGFIALIVVIVLVASTAIALIADNAVKKAQAEADAKIAELENALTGANTDLEAAEKALEELKTQLAAANGNISGLQTLVEGYQTIIDNWTKTTPTIRAFISTEIKPVYDDMIAAIEAGFVADKTVDDVRNEEMDLVIWALRSSDLTDVRAELEKNVAAFDAIRLDKELDRLIAAVKVDGVTYRPDDDRAGIDACEEYLANHPVLQNNPTKDYEGQIAELNAQYDAAKKAYLADEFIKAVNNLNYAVNDNGDSYVTLGTDTTAVKAAWDALVGACTDETEALALTGVQAAHDTWTAVENRLVVLGNAKTAADEINELIAEVVVATDLATGVKLDNLTTKIETWSSDYAIVEAVEPDNWFINDDALQALKEAYQTKINELQELYDKLLEALEDPNFTTITVESGSAIDAAQDAHDAVDVYGDVEALLELPAGTIADHQATIDAAKDAYDALMKKINDLKELIEKTYNAGFRAADLNTNLALIEAGLEDLTNDGHDINVVVGAEHLGMVDVIRLYPAKNQADVVVSTAYVAAHGTVTNDADLAKLSAVLDNLNGIIAGTDKAEIEKLHDDAYVAGLFAAALATEK